MTKDAILAEHVAYFSNLINICEFYEHTGLPAPTHIKDLLLVAHARMEELTKETKHEH